jgi:Ser/Thr protein kinase RdoA (MazF antagonist)
VTDAELAPILAAYGFSAASTLSRLSGGHINQTLLVQDGERRAVLQRLHPIFAAEVQLDIEAITAHLARKGLLTPRLLRTDAGALWLMDAHGGVWRMLSWLDGVTTLIVEQPATAGAAGALLARFHGALGDLQHAFHFTRVGVHDTPAHLTRLRVALERHAQHQAFAAIAPVAERILSLAEQLQPLPALPRRMVHGDPKISNLLFDSSLRQALAWVDLDTLAYSHIPVELGDAFRSWCNPAGEDARHVTFRADVFAAGIEGYASVAGSSPLTAEERASIVLATETIALELASRFCRDALEESYFGWNAEKFASRSAHNLERAAAQLRVAEHVRAQRSVLEDVVRRALGT